MHVAAYRFGQMTAEAALEVADSAAAGVLAGAKKFEAGPIALTGAALWVAYKAGQSSSGKATGLRAFVGGFLAYKAMETIWRQVVIKEPTT
jgi:hypothetical protein